MNQLLRMTFCASLLGLFYVGTCLLRPAVMEDLGLDVWEWPRLQRTLDNELERSQTLEKDLKGSRSRFEAKSRICFDLVAGRLTLRQAAKLFSDLPNPPENFWNLIRASYHAATPEESMCLHVTTWVCALMDRQPHQREAMRRRLMAELQEFSHTSQNQP
jgi:hypothetical protein